MSSLAGRTALVTGSTSGVGLAIAQALAGRGCKVVMNGFGDVASAVDAVRAAGQAASAPPPIHDDADMSRASEIERMVASNLPDILVNNAGIQHVSPVDEFAPEMWDKVLAINLTSAFHTTRLALPTMRQRGWGRIINVASTHGLVGSAFKSAYVASKHGVLGFTKSVALETAETNITCNAICPGWVLTPLVQAQVDARAQEQGLTDAEAKADLLAEKQPSGKFVAPEQLASLSLFLCSDDASEVRGVAWNVDGGWVAR